MLSIDGTARPTSHPHRAARRPRCGVPRGARLRRRAWPFDRCGGPSTRSAGRNATRARADSLRKLQARKKRRRAAAARRRVARSRGAPQRGRRAGDSP